MDTLTQFNQAMQYVEAHLAGEIDFARMAQIAGCTEVHFRRVFAFLAGFSLSEYIRRRRLSQAAADLCASNLRVIDIAVRYGYESADAFSRAFQALHGVTPSEAKANEVSLKSIPPMIFQLTIRGGAPMEYRIVEKGAFSIIGVRKQVPLIYQGVNPVIQAQWENLTDEDYETLDALSDVTPLGILNASLSDGEGHAEGTLIDNYIGVASTQQTSDRWQVLPVTASTWVIFTIRGRYPQALQETWARVHSDWMFTSHYELAVGPHLVWTQDEDMDAPSVMVELWIPIVKRR